MNYLIIAGLALLGAILTSLLGWLKETGPFDVRKFCASMITGIFSAILYAVLFKFSGEKLSAYDCLVAFLGGGGIDTARNRVNDWRNTKKILGRLH